MSAATTICPPTPNRECPLPASSSRGAVEAGAPPQCRPRHFVGYLALAERSALSEVVQVKADLLVRLAAGATVYGGRWPSVPSMIERAHDVLVFNRVAAWGAAGLTAIIAAGCSNSAAGPATTPRSQPLTTVHATTTRSSTTQSATSTFPPPSSTRPTLSLGPTRMTLKYAYVGHLALDHRDGTYTLSFDDPIAVADGEPSDTFDDADCASDASTGVARVVSCHLEAVASFWACDPTDIAEWDCLPDFPPSAYKAAGFDSLHWLDDESNRYVCDRLDQPVPRHCWFHAARNTLAQRSKRPQWIVIGAIRSDATLLVEQIIG